MSFRMNKHCILSDYTIKIDEACHEHACHNTDGVEVVKVQAMFRCYDNRGRFMDNVKTLTINKDLSDLDRAINEENDRLKHFRGISGAFVGFVKK